MKQLHLKTVLHCCIIAVSFQVKAQCKISGPDKICLNNLGLFSMSLPSGSTASAFDWKFGDSYSSFGQNVRHLYKQSGIYTVSCKVKLKNGGTCEDSVKVEVLSLPAAKVLRAGNYDSCQFTNNICFEDHSVAAAGNRPIIKRIVVWGDGDISTALNPANGSTECHHYQANDYYSVKVEVTDQAGCKNSESHNTRIIESLKASIDFNIFYPSCGMAGICFKNQSDPQYNKKHSYTWLIDNEPPVFSTNALYSPCIYSYASKKSIKGIVIAEHANQCRDTFEIDTFIDADTINSVMTVNSTEICYSDAFYASADSSGNETYAWSIEGLPEPRSSERNFSLIPKNFKINPGTYTVVCTVTKGACTKILKKQLTIKGPVASVKLFNYKQCGYDKTVFFIDNTELADRSKASWHWVITDPDGQNCVSERSKDINKYMNCNESRDSYHKHRYSRRQNFMPFYFTVYDSITQCSDNLFGYVHTDACCLGAEPGTIEICQDDTFLELSDLEKELAPKSFSLDTGKTWLPFPSQVSRKYKGMYGVGLTFLATLPYAEDYGDDSFRILVDTPERYDTVFAPDLLMVHEIPDSSYSIDIKKYCGGADVVLKLKQPVMDAGESFNISWGDGTQTHYETITARLKDTLRHRYNIPYLDAYIIVSRHNIRGCADTVKIPVKFGLSIQLDAPLLSCFKTPYCIKANISNPVTGRRWDNDSLGSVKVDFGEGPVQNYSYSSLCHDYKHSGLKKIRIIVNEKGSLCTDTIEKEILVQELRAGVTSESKDFSCAEIRQFFDSSSLKYPHQADAITDYLWDFGSNNYSTVEKNPFHTFDSGSAYFITHVVKSRSGCTDTVRFPLTIFSTNPKFYIPFDTAGCAPFTAVFRNTSLRGSYYSWEFGDYNNTSYVTDSKEEISFTYPDAGKFSIRLTAIDTFYNLATGSVYYCKTSYPGKGKDISVTVYPTPEANFDAPVTGCKGEEISFVNLSDSRYKVLTWDFGDNTSLTAPALPGGTTNHIYDKPGNYIIKLVPDYTPPAGEPKCLNSIERLVTIGGLETVLAVEPPCNSYKYHFAEISEPRSASRDWTFERDGEPYSSSSDQDFLRNFNMDTGYYDVTMIARDSLGCADTARYSFFWGAYGPIRIPNVFTPGVKDGLNDGYDIMVDGETYYELHIYDRWGVEVFSSGTDDANWDGSRNNIECSSGTYYYMFRFTQCEGGENVKTINGTVTLIR